MAASEIEMLIVKDYHPAINSSILTKESGSLNPSQNELHSLNENETLAEILARFAQHNVVRLFPLFHLEICSIIDTTP